MSNIAEKLLHAVQSLPEPQAAEVLDFAEFLLARQGIQPAITSADTEDWSEFERHAGAWTGKFNREDCYDRPLLR